jgi:hypothetical protein
MFLHIVYDPSLLYSQPFLYDTYKTIGETCTTLVPTLEKVAGCMNEGAAHIVEDVV